MILVTGATGKIGVELVRLLTEAKAEARALLRDPAKAKGWEGIEVVKGDLDDGESIAAALRGVDTLLLLTAANVKQELALIEAARRAGVERTVKISAVHASIEARASLVRGHAESEAALQRSGMAWTLLRPGVFSQNFLSFAPAIKAGGTFSASAKDGKIAPIDARDIAAVAAKALLEPGHEGKTYLLTGPVVLSYAEVAEKISAAIGKPVRYVDVPTAESRAAMLGAGMPKWLADDLVTIQVDTASGLLAAVSGDVEAVLGRSPRGFDDFARDYAEAFR